MSTHKTLAEANRVRQAEWAPGHEISGSWRGNELGGEIGEALEQVLLLAIAGGRVQNTVKKLEREALGLPGSRASVENLGKELGDVVICAALVAEKFGINLDRVVALKFNETTDKVGLTTYMEVPDA